MDNIITATFNDYIYARTTSLWQYDYVFSRSANRGNANNVMNVNTSGNVNNTNAWNSNVYAPIVFLKALWLLHSNDRLEDIDKEPKSLA